MRTHRGTSMLGLVTCLVASTRRLRRLILLALTASCLFVGCGDTIAPACPTPVESIGLVVQAGNPINPDVHGHSLPTIVRVYQLKSVGALESASFDAMWRHPTETLGEALVDAQQLTLFPGGHEERAFVRNPDARYLVAMVVVRRPGGQLWRTIVPMPASEAELACQARSLVDAPDAPEVPGLPEGAVGPAVLLLKVDNYAIRGEVTRLEAGEGACHAPGGACYASSSSSSGGEEPPDDSHAPTASDVSDTATDSADSTLPSGD